MLCFYAIVLNSFSALFFIVLNALKAFLEKVFFVMVFLSVVIPAFNKEDSISKTLAEVKRSCDSFKVSYEVVIVDDHSTDNTYPEIVKTVKNWLNFRVFKKVKNGGKGGALKEGFFKAKGDLVAFIDADLDLPPKQLKVFIDLMNVYNADAIIGSKRNSLSKVEYSSVRNFLSWGYYKLVRGLFNLRVSDTQVGMKLFKRKKIEKIISKVNSSGFAFDLELLARMRKENMNIGESPIIMKHSNFGSSVSVFAIAKMLKETLLVYFTVLRG